jgi:hypothetical protein
MLSCLSEAAATAATEARETEASVEEAEAVESEAEVVEAPMEAEWEGLCFGCC